ncbi:MAG: hypothetical protein ACT4QG_17800 [Sporichthyaceae bacterium]
MDDRLIDNFGAARAPAWGRFRIYALRDQGELPPIVTVGLLDAARDRSLQVRLEPTPRRFRRPQIVKTAWACEGPTGWRIVDRGRARLMNADDPRRAAVDVLAPLRAAGTDIATALVLLRAEHEHTVALPTYEDPIRLSTRVDERGVLRVDVESPAFDSPVFLATADASDHDVLPHAWPPLTGDGSVIGGQEFAPFLPPLWRAAVDLIREAGNPH